MTRFLYKHKDPKHIEAENHFKKSKFRVYVQAEKCH